MYLATKKPNIIKISIFSSKLGEVEFPSLIIKSTLIQNSQSGEAEGEVFYFGCHLRHQKAFHKGRKED